MRILQVAAPARFGGLERVVHALATGQRARGHDVQVVSLITPEDADTPFHGPFRDSAVPLHVIELPARAYLRERRAFRELCGRVRPDVVNTHGHRADVIESGVASRLGVPIVSTMHGFFHRGDLRGRITARLQCAALARFDAVIAVSRALADDLHRARVPREIIVPIVNAWHETSPPLSPAAARHALGIPDDALVVGCVGRVTGQKALDVAMAAMGHLRDTAATLSIVGDGEERGSLEARARTLGITDRVRWHGARTNAHELMTAFDVFLLSSRWEGTPIVLLEAMAAGVPVVATRVGGVPDVVSEREAMLVPAEDALGLAAAIRSVLTDRDAADRRARAAELRLRVDFGFERWLDRYDGVYERVVRGRQRSSPG